MSGWAADESGVLWIRLYADDQIIEHIPLNIPRPDVEKEFPQFTRPGALHGWQATIDFGDHVGYTHISAEALDGRGALTRFASFSVKSSTVRFTSIVACAGLLLFGAIAFPLLRTGPERRRCALGARL